MKQLMDRFKMLDVKESFKDYMARTKMAGDEEIRTLRKAPLIELTLEEICWKICK